jgi:hypothetical protein
MGKLVTYLTLLIFIDIFFIATGQICNDQVGCSIGSIIFNSILNVENITSLNFFTQLIGDIGNLFNSATGIGALILGATVIIGSFFIPGEIRVFIPLAFTFALLIADFVFIATYLISLNALLGTVLMAPIAILYILVVIEWLKGKD